MFPFRASDGTARGPCQYQERRHRLKKPAHEITTPSIQSFSQSFSYRERRCILQSPFPFHLITVMVDPRWQ
jgi:hypothetical protein